MRDQRTTLQTDKHAYKCCLPYREMPEIDEYFNSFIGVLHGSVS